MRPIRFFFTFRGRITRRSYWLGVFALAPPGLLVTVLGFLLAAGDAGGLAGIAYVVLGPALFVAGLSLLVRRLHDRDRPGWLVVVLLTVPGGMQGIAASQQGALATALQIGALVLPLVVLAEVGFLPGTPGPNAYGPDPLEP